MFPIEPGDAGELIETAVTAISVLGGAMAYCSGYSASKAVSEEQPTRDRQSTGQRGAGGGLLLGLANSDHGSYHQDVDLMARFLKFPRGAVVLSTIVSMAAGVAIVGFGAPPAILILASWAGATVYMELNSRINRRLGRR
jgi:hypothetical protein